jgi:hypothetical protein
VSRAAVASLLLAGTLVLGGCAGDAPTKGTVGKDITTLAPELLPPEMLGLQVAHEDVSDAVDHFPASYTDAVSVWSFRRDELLQATLQVSRFRDPAKLRSAKLRRTLVSQVGGARSQTIHVGERTVYLTTGTKQRLAVWFDERFVFVLAMRDDYMGQRNLLRAAVGIEP